jgi:integrase
VEYAVKPFPAVTECVAKTKKHKPLSVQTNAPKYRGEESLPFVPDEKELDQLIAACKSRRMAAYLQTLKETFADPGEILRLEWKEIDFKNNIISVNHPVKGHDPRQLQVSTKLLAMLSALPKKDKRVFPTIYQNIVTCFRILRARTATVLQNPRLLEIQLRTFRHWGGTMIAHYTHGNVLAVKRALGHKNIQNTMKYIHLVHFKDDEFEVATATSVDEAKQLASSGYEKFDEFQGIHIFRKPKRLLCYS